MSISSGAGTTLATSSTTPFLFPFDSLWGDVLIAVGTVDVVGVVDLFLLIFFFVFGFGDGVGRIRFICEGLGGVNSLCVPGVYKVTQLTFYFSRIKRVS